jgi:hypothetical protein
VAARTGDGDTEYGTVGVDARELGRFADVTLEDGEVIVYDQENEDAWVQSSSAIGLEFMV